MVFLGIKDELLDLLIVLWNVNKIGGLFVSFFFIDIVIYKYVCVFYFLIYVYVFVLVNYVIIV